MKLPWQGTTPEISSEDDSRYETPGGAQNKVNVSQDYLLHLLKLAVTGLSNGSEAAIARYNDLSGITYEWLKERLDAEYAFSLGMFKDTGNIKSFGGKADGVTNDYSALVSALAVHDNVIIPSNCKISQNITIGSNKVITFLNGSDFILAEGVTLTNNGTSIRYGGITGYNSVVYHTTTGKSNKPMTNETAYHAFVINDDEVDQSAMSGSKVDGVGVRHSFGGSNANGGRHGLQANLFLTSPTSPTSIDRNYVGLQGQFIGFSGDGGTLENPRGAGFGSSSYGALKNAPHFYNLSGAEINTIIDDNSSVFYHSGIQVASSIKHRGTSVDAGLVISNLDLTGLTWKNAILISASNGAPALGSDSVAIEIKDSGIIDKGIYFNGTLANSYLSASTVEITSNTLELKSGNNDHIILGSPTIASAPFIEFRTSGAFVPNVRVTASGVLGADFSGVLTVQASSLDVSGAIRPSADNIYSLGDASHRFSQVYAGTGTINTSDERDKENISTLSLDIAQKFIEGLEAKTYKFKDEEERRIIHNKNNTRHKFTVSYEPEEVEEYNIVNGVAVLTKTTKMVETKFFLFDEYPVYDEFGVQVFDTIPEKRNPDGTILFPSKSIPRVHKVPVMETVEDIEIESSNGKKNVRTHFGFIAQDVEQMLSSLGLTTNDFAGLIIDEETGKYGLRYDEVLTMLFPVVKSLLQRVAELEKKVNA